MKKRFFTLILSLCISVSLCVSCDGLFGSESDPCPWCGEEDCNCLDEMTPQIDEVIGEDLYNAISNYIPLYEGVNPPAYIEGVYLIYEMETIFCSDNHYEIGETVQPIYLEFSNQDNSTLSIAYRDINYLGNMTNAADNAVIRGDDKNFTVFFSYETTTTGTYGNAIELTVGMVVSGTASGYGIEDISYAFIMIDKENDTSGNIMDKGAYRIFGDKDGLSNYTYWPESEEE